MFIRFVRLLIIIVCLACVVHTQRSTDPLVQPESTKLPSAFSRFSSADVLKAIWDDYDSKTGRITHVLNEQKQPSLARLDIARKWMVGRKNYLVVLTEIAGYDEQFGELGLCGNCGAASPLAVLEVISGKLVLVAKQDDDFYQSKDGEDNSTGYEAFWYNGHDLEVKLDLAPYRLNNREVLIGVRRSHMWIPAQTYSTELQLFRIDGIRLREVFDELVIDRDFPRGLGKDPLAIDKSLLTLTMRPTNGNFNDIVVTKTTHRCNGNNETYDCNGGKLLGAKKYVWHFDGDKFVEPIN